MTSLLPWTASVARQQGRTVVQRSATSQFSSRSINSNANIQSQRNRQGQIRSALKRPSSSSVSYIHCAVLVSRANVSTCGGLSLSRSFSTSPARNAEAMTQTRASAMSR